MRLAVIILVMLGLVASGAAVLLYQSMRASFATDKQGDMVDVLVAQTDLKAQTKLDVNDVEVTQVPDKALPLNYLTSPAQVTGAKLKADVSKGQPLTASLITREMTVVDLLHDGMRGFGLSLSRRETGTGLVRPGSVVDLHVTFPISDKEIGESLVIAPLLQQLPVLAVDGETIFTEGEVKASARRSTSGNVEVMLEVNDAQASVLQLAHQKGKLALPLRNPTDTTFYSVQPMIVKQGVLEPFGDPLDPQDPAGLMNTIRAVIERRSEPIRDVSDPNASDLFPVLPVYQPAEPTPPPARKKTIVEVIRGNETTEKEVKDKEDQPVGGGG